ncbi:hypothetical protein J2S53_001966 [Actinopolyspora lacussalsi]|nr:hypothetical protein [Actinopolyspora lacussalsi]
MLGRLMVRRWLRIRKNEVRREAELSELLALRFDGIGKRRRNDLERKLGDLADNAGERLQALTEREFERMPENDRLASLQAVGDALAETDLSDAALFEMDLDPDYLARRVRERVPTEKRRADLGTDGVELFDLVLSHTCFQLVRLIWELPEFQPRAQEETLRRTTEIIGKLDEVLDRIPVTSLDAPEGTDHDERFHQRYLELVAKEHEKLELIGVSVRQFQPSTTLSVAYLSLTVNQQEEQSRKKSSTPRVDIGWFLDRGEAAPSSVRVESALGRSHLTLVRGEAGSGKSTLLRWLAVTAARKGFAGELSEWNGTVPFLIKLRGYAGSDLPAPEELLNGQSTPMTGPVPTGWVHRQMLAGRALLLIDGVDELSENKRPQVRKWLRSMLNAYPEMRVVVTSRPAAANARWLREEGFGSVNLESMSPADVRVFMRRWHDALLDSGKAYESYGGLPWSSEEIDKQHRALLSKLDARAHLRNFTRNPLMCAMLCALNLDRGSNLPRDRNSLYEAALEMLLDRRETDRDIPSSRDVELGYRDKRTILRDLAFRLSLNGWSEIRKENALDRIKRKIGFMPNVVSRSELVLDHLLNRSGIIREPVDGRVDFVHRTFQEYLAAAEAAEEQDTGMLIERAHKDQWRETVIMAAGLLNRKDSAELVEGILDKAEQSENRNKRKLRLVAASCRESLHELSPKTSERLDANIRELVPPRKSEEAASLATVGETVLDYLPRSLESLTEAQAQACVVTARLVNGPKALEILSLYSTDPRGKTQEELTFSWDYFAPGEYVNRVLKEAPLSSGIVFCKTPEQAKYLKNIKNLKSTHLTVDPSFKENFDLSSIPHLNSISFFSVKNPNLESLENKEELQSITFFDTQNPLELSNLRQLGEAANLKRLGLLQRDPIGDISFLENISSLFFLVLQPLHGVHDYTPISKHKLLHQLSLSGCSQLADLEIFTQLDNLESLSLFELPESIDLRPLAKLNNLSRLLLAEGPEELDLRPFAGHRMRIVLSEDQHAGGLNELGSGVEIERINLAR